MKLVFTLGILFISSLAMLGQDCLVAAYPFNGNAEDTTGNYQEGIVSGAESTENRYQVPNTAYEFGGSDYIDTRSSFDFEEQSISIWFNSYLTTSGSFVLVQDAASLQHGTIELKIDDSKLYANPGAEGPNLVFVNVLPNEWYNVVITRNAFESNVYVNGVLKYTGTPSSGGSSVGAYKNLVLGANRFRDDGFFRGVIDELRVFDCELDESDINNLYTSVKETKAAATATIAPSIISNSGVLTLPKPLEADGRIDIYDAAGRIVRSKNMVRGAVNANIERGDLEDGMYFLAISEGNKVFGSLKFIISQ